MVNYTALFSEVFLIFCPPSFTSMRVDRLLDKNDLTSPDSLFRQTTWISAVSDMINKPAGGRLATLAPVLVNLKGFAGRIKMRERFFSALTFCATLAALKAVAPDGTTSRSTLSAMTTCPPKTLRADPSNHRKPATELYVTGCEGLCLVLSHTLHVSLCLVVA